MGKVPQRELDRQKEKRRWRQQHGLCTFCDEKAEPGKRRCARHAALQNHYIKCRRRGLPKETTEKYKQRAKERLDELRREGRCVTCGEKATKGEFCDRHAELRREANRRRRKSPVCVCGNPKKITSARCHECNVTRSKRDIAKFNERVANGLCYHCGEVPHRPGRKSCARCAEIRTEWQKTRGERYLAEGLCRQCGKEKHLEHQTTCLQCYLKFIANQLFRSREKWKELLDLFNSQSGKCSYSGESLILGCDAELDHIIPESKGGPTEIGNLHWIHCMVNQMKFNYSEDDFLKMVKTIYDFRIKDKKEV